MGTVRKVSKEIEIIEKYYEPANNSEKENSAANLILDLQKLIKYAENNKDNRRLTRNWCCYHSGFCYRTFMNRYRRWSEYEPVKVKVRSLFEYWQSCLDINRQKAKFDTNETKIVDSIALTDPISMPSDADEAIINLPQGIVIHVPK